jgi:hypothetical protein
MCHSSPTAYKNCLCVCVCVYAQSGSFFRRPSEEIASVCARVCVFEAQYFKLEKKIFQRRVGEKKMSLVRYELSKNLFGMLG